ncbi:MAG TPA: chorismate synthase [Dictyoglomaceae bacterium]|nr:chorismate synthase [Dictyoglomaceae bacterium]HOL38763.1 chorismate synthase [Dictyoglomaceae bacterium]HOP94533.1 chorismate synthase [Dictyoglomaceae bacterium]HPP15488.1 chorismate synthase [Dictyoglomaceae bacterium]HPU43103.1 chorismate synthase [Dictyoglomaceae bacterium]
MRFLTAGESHGKGLIAIIEGVPAGLKINVEDINRDLLRRQKGYGRGKRMEIESDTVELFSGIRGGYTLGSPIGLLIKNKDWENWKETMDSQNITTKRIVTKPRAGHADFSGAIKYNFCDIRNVLERASARETAIRVAVGAIAKAFLREFEIEIISFVESIGNIKANFDINNFSWDEVKEKSENSEVRMLDSRLEEEAKNLIDFVKENGDTLGGTFILLAKNVPMGLGSYVHWDRRLDALLTFAIMSIPSVKGVEIGEAFLASTKRGSEVHDEFTGDKERFRRTNFAGGIEGGISNGEVIMIRTAVKPVPTLRKPLKTFDLEKKEMAEGYYERSDVCVVPSAGVIGEAMMAWVIADEFLKKFAGDYMEEIKKHFEDYKNYLMERLGWKS